MAFAAKDAVLVVDDFAPSGTTQDRARLHREAARILRAQGNRIGRARLRPDATLRATKAPRGLILSTGEDVPTGQSIRARIIVVEIGPNDLDFDRLTEAQSAEKAGLYAQTMAGYLCWLAGRLDEERDRFLSEADNLRTDAWSGSRHRRTSWIVAELGAALKVFVRFAVAVGAKSEKEGDRLWHQCWEALLKVADAQAEHLASEDPARRFLTVLGAAVASGRAYIGNAADPDESPADPGELGWLKRTMVSGGHQFDEWMPQGERVGWVNEEDLYLIPDAAFAVAERMANPSPVAM